MILILTNKWDISVDFVIKQLQTVGVKYLRLNTEDLPKYSSTINFPNFEFRINKKEEEIDLSKTVKVVWNRRPGLPFENVSYAKKTGISRFIDNQWFTWIESLQLIPNVTWINNPIANTIMECKPRQLFLADKMGFSIPKTIISNDILKINSFLDRNQKNIVKALYSPLIKEKDVDKFIYTNCISQIDGIEKETIQLSPSIFQQSINPKIDYRVTVVGNEIFPVRISIANYGSDFPVDWRTIENGITYQLCHLPEDIEQLCKRYVKENGLLFGSIDLVEQDGVYFFLEINPNGEWGWLQYPNKIPIAESITKLLVYCEKAGSNEI